MYFVEMFRTRPKFFFILQSLYFCLLNIYPSMIIYSVLVRLVALTPWRTLPLRAGTHLFSYVWIFRPVVKWLVNFKYSVLYIYTFVIINNIYYDITIFILRYNNIYWFNTLLIVGLMNIILKIEPVVRNNTFYIIP